MKTVPYHGNPGNACALAAYTMVAQYLLPDKKLTFEQLGKIAGWRKGYVVWGFDLWKWLMDQGVHIVDYDTIDYEAWASEGVDGLKRSVPEKEFNFYKENTLDLEAESKLVDKMLNHPNFTYIKRKPTWEDVVKEFIKPGITDLSVNSRQLNGKDGFALHRVVLLDISDTEIVFHDPNKDWSGIERRVPLSKFRAAFESLDEPEMARYYLD